MVGGQVRHVVSFHSGCGSLTFLFLPFNLSKVESDQIYLGEGEKTYGRKAPSSGKKSFNLFKFLSPIAFSFSFPSSPPTPKAKVTLLLDLLPLYLHRD
jgi:hypothetical protein